MLNRAPGPDVELDPESIGWSGEAVNLFGGAAVQAHDGKVSLPGDGPTAQIWQLT
jgi:hypothetical protein